MNTLAEGVVKDIIKKMRLNPITTETVLKLTLICFSGFCNCLTNGVYEAKYLKYKLEDTIQSNEVDKSFDLLFQQSSLNNDFLKNFLENISHNNITKDMWRDIIEYLIQDVLVSKNIKELATPEFIDQLCLHLLNPKEGTFYDGAAGVGSTVISAKIFSEQLKIYAQELNPLYHSILTLRAYIHGIDCACIRCGDTLTEPQFIKNATELQTFDYSVMFPPIGINRKYHHMQFEQDKFKRFAPYSPPLLSAEWYFIQHQYASLNATGKGIAIIPSGCLYNGMMEPIREKILAENAVECVISLPPNLLSYTAMPLHLLILNKNKHKNDNARILFIRAEELFEQYKTDYKKGSEEILKEITDIYNTEETREGISRIVPVSRLENSILLPSRYIQKPIEDEVFGRITVTELYEDDRWTQLKTTGTFYRGVNLSASSKGTNLTEAKIINYTDVQNGTLCLDGIQKREVTWSAFEKNRVKAGDILISCKGTAIKICVVPEHDEPLLLSANFIGIHIDPTKYDPNFIKYYLESPVGQSCLSRIQVGTSIFTLAGRDLEMLPVPCLSLKKQKEYVNELIHTEKIIYEQIEDLYTRSAKAKWDFYTKIGLGEIITKENDSL